MFKVRRIKKRRRKAFFPNKSKEFLFRCIVLYISKILVIFCFIVCILVSMYFNLVTVRLKSHF